MAQFNASKPQRTYDRIKERNWRKFLAALTLWKPNDALTLRIQEVPGMSEESFEAMKNQICSAMDMTQ